MQQHHILTLIAPDHPVRPYTWEGSLTKDRWIVETGEFLTDAKLSIQQQVERYNSALAEAAQWCTNMWGPYTVDRNWRWRLIPHTWGIVLRSPKEAMAFRLAWNLAEQMV